MWVATVRYRVSEESADVDLYIVIIKAGAESFVAFIHHSVTGGRTDIAPNTYWFPT